MFSYSQQHLEYPWVCQESAGNHWQLVWCEAVAQLPGSLLHVSTVPVSRIWPGCCSPCLKLNSSVSGDGWECQVSSHFPSLLRFILRRNWYHFEIFFKNDSLSTVWDEVLWSSNGLALNSLKRTIQSMDAMGKQGKKGKQKTSRHQPFVIIWCCCWVERYWLQTKIYDGEAWHILSNHSWLCNNFTDWQSPCTFHCINDNTLFELSENLNNSHTRVCDKLIFSLDRRHMKLLIHSLCIWVGQQLVLCSSGLLDSPIMTIVTESGGSASVQLPTLVSSCSTRCNWYTDVLYYIFWGKICIYIYFIIFLKSQIKK